MPTLRILAFGASLVRGRTDSGRSATPFARWMRERLVAYFQGEDGREGEGRKVKWDVETVVKGVDGDMATLGFGVRMPGLWEVDVPRDSKMSLRILCLGDSLTEGYTRFGTVWAPYSAMMKFILEQGDWTVDVVTDGQSGDLVSKGMGTFEKRMERRYETSTTRYPLYDYTIILGGTNDLGYGRPPQAIYDALTAVSDIPLAHGSKVLLCTVPESSQRSSQKRDALNALIKSDTRDHVYIFDLKEKVPYHSMPEEERNEIWDDGLHFTAKGYERMGVMIAERLIEIIEKEGGK